jgi:hypothetical protein
VVFYYDEPNRLVRTYVNTDLKSYKKGSITSTAIASAIESLALTLECAELSEEWREKFVHDEKSYEIAGLLFIYNHDGEYDKDFDQILAKVNHEKLKIPKDSKIFIFGPSHIRWLDIPSRSFKLSWDQIAPEILIAVRQAIPPHL